MQNQEQLEATLNTATQIRQDVSQMQTAVAEAKKQVEQDKKDIDDTKEDVLSLKIDSFNEQMEPKIIRISKAKEKDIEKLKTNITQYLSKDKAVNIAAITKLLKELIQ